MNAGHSYCEKLKLLETKNVKKLNGFSFLVLRNSQFWSISLEFDRERKSFILEVWGHDIHEMRIKCCCSCTFWKRNLSKFSTIIGCDTVFSLHYSVKWQQLFPFPAAAAAQLPGVQEMFDDFFSHHSLGGLDLKECVV